jgi:hypothetical protein
MIRRVNPTMSPRLRAVLAHLVVFSAVVGCVYLPVARIDIHNDTPGDITELHLEGRCSDHSLGVLEAGASTTAWVSTRCGESGPQVTFRQGEHEHRGAVGYVDSKLVPRKIIRIGRQGDVSQEFVLGGPAVLTPWPVRFP